MRGLKHYTRVWRTASDLRKQRFFDVFSTQSKDGPLDASFIELVHKRRSSVSQIGFKLLGLQIPILALLVFSMIPIQASVSILGITPGAGRSLREVLIVMSAVLGVSSAGLGIYYAVLTELIETYTARKSKGNAEVLNLLGIGHGVNFLIWPEVHERNLQIGWGFKAFLAIVFVVIVILTIALIAAYLALHLYILRDIYIDPSFSRSVSVFVIIFVLLADFVSLSIRFLANVPIALRDHSNLMKLAELGENDPERQKRVYLEIARRHRNRPWLVRLLTRAKMPKKLPE